MNLILSRANKSLTPELYDDNMKTDVMDIRASILSIKISVYDNAQWGRITKLN